MNYDELYNLLIRYVDGEATVEETTVVEELLRSDDYWKNEFEILKSLNEHIQSGFDYSINANTNANWEAMKSKIEPVKSVTLWPSFYKYAAAAIVIFVAGWFLFKPAKNDFASFDSGKVYSTGIHEITTIKLDDGSKIVLNENSVLTLDKDFNKSNRLIELNGEAYFEVAKNTERPFVAKTKNTFTRVLGTSFEIESTNENQVSVTLFEGKVQFSSGKEKEILKPGEKLSCSLINNTIEKHQVKTLAKDVWVNGLAFKDAKLDEIVKSLESLHNIHITIPDTIRNEQYTVSFEGLDLAASLKLLEELTDSKITKKDSDYILNP